MYVCMYACMHTYFIIFPEAAFQRDNNKLLNTEEEKNYVCMYVCTSLQYLLKFAPTLDNIKNLLWTRNSGIFSALINLLNLVCHDVEIEPVLQEITGESLVRGANTAPDARLDIHVRGF